MSIIDKLNITFTSVGWNKPIENSPDGSDHNYYFPKKGVTFDFSDIQQDGDQKFFTVAIGGATYSPDVKAAKEASRYIVNGDGNLEASFEVVPGEPITELVTIAETEIAEGKYLTHTVKFFDGALAKWICIPRTH